MPTSQRGWSGVYRRPYDANFPVVCMDETPRQLIGETRTPVPPAPGRAAREDYEYRRLGTCNVFMATEPLAGRRQTKVTERRTKTDWARFLRDIAAQYPGATRITLVMDNLNTHRPGALYETFEPAEAKALWDRFEFVHTPKHGSWLNVAEVELNVMIRQCLNPMEWTPPPGGIAMCQDGTEAISRPSERGGIHMEEVSIIGIDLAKRSFQVHGARPDGPVAYRRKLSRAGSC